MSGPKRKSHRSGYFIHCLLFVLITVWTSQSVQAQQAATSATLNDPASATSTPSKGTGVDSNSTSSSASTSVIAVPLSTQTVPYLVKVPQAKNGQRDAYFTGCSDSSSVGYVSAQNRFNISTVYSQLDRYTGDSALGNGYPISAGILRIVGIGSVGNQSYAFNSYTDSMGATVGLLSECRTCATLKAAQKLTNPPSLQSLGAIQVSTRFSTLPVFSNYTYLCDRLYPTQNDSAHPDVNPASCQYGPGTVSFGIDVPLNATYEAGTLVTEIRLTDSSSPALTIACVELYTSPYVARRWFWELMMWLPVGLVIAYFILTTLATLLAAEIAQRSAFKNRAREGGAPKLFRDKLSPMTVSAFSGRGHIASPPLLRFVTPGCWDIIYHLQFIVAITMCHVQWPDFVYPFMRQVAWSALLGNVTLTQSSQDGLDPLSTDALLPSGDIGSQMSNAASPLYMNATQSNTLLNLQQNDDGIATYANMIGLRSENLFGTCLSIWLSLVAAIIVLSAIAWLVDSFFKAHEKSQQRRDQSSMPLSSSPGLDGTEADELKGWDADKLESLKRGDSPSKRSNLARWKTATGLHGRALHGNLVRALLVFHLPITIVSTYQFAFAKQHSTVSVALAALAFTILSILVPAYIIFRITRTPLKKLYDHIGTLLEIGSAYHLYSPGSQLFYIVSFAHSLILGVVVGAGQRSGAAQAIVIIIAEVIVALASILWLPWGEGAMMGPLSFMANVVRCISAILLLLLTSLVGLSFSARVWLTYVILLLQGIYLAGAVLVFLVKLTEAMVRLIWRVKFDEDHKTSIRFAGLGGAIRKIKRRKLKQLHRRSNSSSLRLQRVKMDHRMSNMSDGSTAHMLQNAQQIPMSDARSGSYAEYLGAGTARPPSTHLNSSNRINEEGGHIMAALPHVSPGGSASLHSPGPAAFVRTGGGKATDVNPYAALPTQESISRGLPASTSRPQSQSGIFGSWATNDAGPGMTAGQRDSYFALPRQSPDDLISTQAAAIAARKAIELQQQQQLAKAIEKKEVSGNRFPWVKTAKSKQEVEEENEWSDGDMTWDSNGKGAWAGVAKMGAAFTGVRKKFMGGRDRNDEDLIESSGAGMGNLPPSGSGGFEVVRPVRPQVTPKKTSPVPASSSSPSPSPQPQGTEAQKAKVDMNGNSQRNPRDVRGHLGILGADLERVTSIGAFTEGGEERFWLPPLDLGGSDEGKL
jgi:hypothetical protein